MHISNLTLEERERIAYIEGHPEKAALLGEMMDLQAELDEATSDERLEAIWQEGFDACKSENGIE